MDFCAETFHCTTRAIERELNAWAIPDHEWDRVADYAATYLAHYPLSGAIILAAEDLGVI